MKRRGPAFPAGRLKIYIRSQMRRFVFPARQRGPAHSSRALFWFYCCNKIVSPRLHRRWCLHLPLVRPVDITVGLRSFERVYFRRAVKLPASLIFAVVAEVSQLSPTLPEFVHAVEGQGSLGTPFDTSPPWKLILCGIDARQTSISVFHGGSFGWYLQRLDTLLLFLVRYVTVLGCSFFSFFLSMCEIPSTCTMYCICKYFIGVSLSLRKLI